MESSKRSLAEFKRQLLWIGIAAFVAACMAMVVLVLTGPISLSIVLAAALGTFFSFWLGGGLMAALFYSERSGYDESPTILADSSHPVRRPE